MARPAVIDAVHRPWVLYSCRRRARDHSGAFLSHELYSFALGQRHERQHQAAIQRADQQLLGAPDARLALEFRRTADVHFGLAGRRRPAAASTVPDQAVVIAEGLVCFLSFHVSLQDWSWVAPER